MEAYKEKSAGDIEAPIVVDAVPIVAETTSTAPTMRERIIRVYEIPAVREDRPDPLPQLLVCAIVGCLFSWIPIIGCLTWIVNITAPPGSPRRIWANTACAIATLVVFFNIFFWCIWSVGYGHH
eukprot:scaffold601_cov170-Ochromonas_danica.AAC.44